MRRPTRPTRSGLGRASTTTCNDSGCSAVDVRTTSPRPISSLRGKASDRRTPGVEPRGPIVRRGHGCCCCRYQWLPLHAATAWWARNPVSPVHPRRRSAQLVNVGMRTPLPLRGRSSCSSRASSSSRCRGAGGPAGAAEWNGNRPGATAPLGQPGMPASVPRLPR